MLTLDDYGRLVEDAPAGLAAPPAGPLIPPPPAVSRSGKWPGLLRDFLREHPTCEGCGRRAETGHHAVPVAVEPGRELDPGNVVAVCVPCHFAVAHLGSWTTYDPDPRGGLAAHRRRVKAAWRV